MIKGIKNFFSFLWDNVLIIINLILFSILIKLLVVICDDFSIFLHNAPEYIGVEYMGNYSYDVLGKDVVDNSSIELIDSMVVVDDNLKNTVSIEDIHECLDSLPIKLLNVMMDFGLKIEIADSFDSQSEDYDNGILTGFYEYEERKIVYCSNITSEGLIHEIGHWFHHYISSNIDYRCEERISESMVNEVYNLGLSDFDETYALSDIFETVAFFFEYFVNNNEEMREKAPISYEYMSYYMDLVL